MTLALKFVGFALVLSATSVDARVGDVTGSKSSEEKRADISPTLVPESDKKFFGKDYPSDKRPAVDVLHFKHPYPVVQDSGDFDADYVKDENSDNGEWLAQSEYDRLRHKLTKEKDQVGKALAAREHAEKELQEAMKRDKEMKEKKAAAEEAKRVATERKRQMGHAEGEADVGHETSEKAGSGPGGVSSSGEVQVATAATEKAMKDLEDCKKELQEAREKLKKLMEELEEARKKEKDAESVLDAADEKARVAESANGAAEKAAQEEYKEYMDAKEKYMAQQAIVAQMTTDIEAAAAKVRAMRDSEDADGGVYPTPSTKNYSRSSAVLSYSAVLIVCGCVAFFVL
mmetsp:Transcript_91802/g.144125  ORF Transcript_91802/g.144125 Transcript_91802/m.144125 type:complete len:344 (+) Transcript_91802:47-1078(+)